MEAPRPQPGPCTQAALRDLPEAERAVLTGLAGLGVPTANGHLAQALARAAAHPEAPAWAANPRKVQTLLERLAAKGLAVERRGHWHCREACLESAARLAGPALLARLFHAVRPGPGMVPDGAMRSRAELRLALVEGRTQDWLTLRASFREAFAPALAGRDPLALVCGRPFDPAWFQGLGPEAQALGSHALLLDHALFGHRDPAWMAWVEERAAGPATGPLAPTLIVQDLLQGRLDRARARMGAQGEGARRHPAWPALEGLAALSAGEAAQAALHYQEAARRIQGPLPGLHEPFHILALLGSRQRQAPLLARNRAERLAREGGPLGALGGVLTWLCGALEGMPEPLGPEAPGPLGLALTACCAHLGGQPLPVPRIQAALAACEGLLAWPAADLAELARRAGGGAPHPRPLLDLAPPEAPWERALRAIARMGAPLD